MEFIFDRTENDVAQAKELRKNKVSNGIELSDSEESTMERGFMTLNTLNRIEHGICDSQTKLREIGYYLQQTPLIEWQFVANPNSVEYREDSVVFKSSNFQAILDKLKVIRGAIGFPDSTPQVPNAEYHWKTLNDMEQILNDVNVATIDVKQNYRECGAYYCGEDDYIG